MLTIDRVREDLHGGLARLLLRHGIPGASIAVSVGDEAAEAAAGVVNSRTGVAADAQAVFQIQSITKVWTSTLVMQLADEGRIDLDDPIATHLPGFRTADPRASARVTVRHLLTHTGGFEGDVWTATTAGDDALQRLVEDVIPAVPQHEPPGSRYSYCSAGMAVLGRLVEVLRGRPFATVLREHLADPLGIKEIACNADEALGFNTAIGHASYGDQGTRPLPMWAALPESNPAAGNQLSMSARALLAFGRMHLDDGLAPNGERLLSADSAKAMRVGGVAIPGSPAEPKEVGLGWEVRHGGAVICHAGGAPGFSSILLLLPGSRTAIAVLTNGGDFNGLMRDLIDPWIAEAADVTLMPDRRLPETAPQITGPDRFVGVYGVRNMRVAIQSTGDGLELELNSTGEAAAIIERAGLPLAPFTAGLRQVSGDLFIDLAPDGGAGSYLQFFDADRDGRAAFIHVSGRALPRIEDPLRSARSSTV